MTSSTPARSWQARLGQNEAAVLARLCSDTGLTRRELAEGLLRYLDQTPEAVEQVVKVAPQYGSWGGSRPGAGRPPAEEKSEPGEKVKQEENP